MAVIQHCYKGNLGVSFLIVFHKAIEFAAEKIRLCDVTDYSFSAGCFAPFCLRDISKRLRSANRKRVERHEC